MLFLSANNFTTYLYINAKIFRTEFKSLTKEVAYFNPEESRLSEFKKIFRYIKSNGISKVIFNTAHGLLVRDFILYSFLIFSKCKFYGILHQAEKPETSFTQKVISLRTKNYFVLSDTVMDYAQKYSTKGIRVSSFYPIFFPQPKSLTQIKNNGDFIVCIPGAIEPERKDYYTLVDLIVKHQDEIGENIKFELLGNMRSIQGKKLYDYIFEKRVNDYFITHTEYLHDNEFFQRIINSQIILPLIHPAVKEFAPFLKTSISGAFSLGFAFQKPFLLHNKFNVIDDFNGISEFYETGELISRIIKLSKNTELLASLNNGYSSKQKFSFEEQSEKYIALLK